MIVLFGGSGRVGSAVVRTLKRSLAVPRGRPVCRVVTRRPEAVDFGRGVEIVRGNFDDAASIRRALADCRRLFLLSPSHPDMDRREIGVIEAAERAGVEAIVKISGSEGLVSEGSRSLTMRQHYAAERALEGSALRWAILRPSAYIQTTIEQIAPFVRDSRRFALPGAGGAVAFVDVRDVGEVAAALLAGEGPWNRRFVITGPAALGPGDLAQLLSRELGEPVRYRRQSLFFARLAINQQIHSPHARNELADLAALLSRGFEDRRTDTVAKILGRPPRSVRAWIRENRDLFVR